MKEYKPRITVGEFRKMLEKYDDDLWLDFSMLDFYRLKQRSSTDLQVEFDQMVSRDEKGDVVVDNLE